jgi:hypothetical protein
MVMGQRAVVSVSDEERRCWRTRASASRGDGRGAVFTDVLRAFHTGGCGLGAPFALSPDLLAANYYGGSGPADDEAARHQQR